MFSRTVKSTVLVTVVLLVMGVCATAALAVSSHVGKPVLSGTPTMNEAFTVSGVTTPTAKKGVTTVVKIRVLMRMEGDTYEPMDGPVKAKLSRRGGASGYKYSASITIPMTGDHAVQAVRYANGKVIGKSRVTYFEVMDAAEQIAMDSDSHADVTAAAHTPLDVIFHSPSGRMCGTKIYFVASGDWIKTSSAPLTYHTEGLLPGIYAWRCPMTDCCYGNLVVQ
jgi:hypothetical protein